jgi:uncharacterized protein YrrD
VRRNCVGIAICAMAAAAGRCVPPLPSIPEALAKDLIITAAIKTALLNDHEVKGVRIDVETVRGIVTLSGVVPTEMGERRAIELAGAVNGVVDVKSRLRIERSPTEPVRDRAQECPRRCAMHAVDAALASAKPQYFVILTSRTAVSPPEGGRPLAESHRGRCTVMKTGADVLGIAIKADDGRRIGTVQDLLFDDRCSRVLGLVMRSGYVFRTRQVVGFSEVQEIRPTAVVVADAHPRRPDPDEIAALGTDRHSMQGKPVVTREGEYIGAVRDVLFDEESGRVLGFEVAYPKANGLPRRRTGIRADLASVVSDAVVVSEASS